MQNYIDGIIAQQRKERMEGNDQMTLGQMIDALQTIKSPGIPVIYDFEYLYPTKIDSWRGVYAELALNFVSSDNWEKQQKEPQMKVSDFLQMLKDAVGETFTGYKGGEFKMNRNTPVWVANPGNSGNTAVIGILDNDYQVIILTGYRE